MINKLMLEEFMWFPRYQFGYSPITNCRMYDEGYFNIYKHREATELGKKLNAFRIELVNEYIENELALDIGIGSGFFLRERGNCVGYDVCPPAIDYLKSTANWYDPYLFDVVDYSIKGVTFFDSLEHLKNPGIILSKLENQFVFISMPIFEGLDHVLGSKHFKPKEHSYYFTKTGLIDFMKRYDFEVKKIQDDETKLGRENIMTFVFRRE